MEVLHIRFTGKAGIRRDHCTCLVDIFGNPQPSGAPQCAPAQGQCVMLLPSPKACPSVGCCALKPIDPVGRLIQGFQAFVRYVSVAPHHSPVDLAV